LRHLSKNLELAKNSLIVAATSTSKIVSPERATYPQPNKKASSTNQKKKENAVQSRI